MNQQNDLERFREWVRKYDDLPPEFQIDYTSETETGAAIHPVGLQEIRRTEDIWGRVTVFNQYNFNIYRNFTKAEGGATAFDNQSWVMGFQQWVQEQSALRLAPTFGNVDTEHEVIQAQNGMLYATPSDEIATYYVQVGVQFKIRYGE